jgi:hypothetical protein
MASTMNVTLLVVALIAAATVLPGTQADELVVGDTTGWQVPPNTTFYSEWAAKNTFSVGDTLGELETYIPTFSMVSLFVELIMHGKQAEQFKI